MNIRSLAKGLQYCGEAIGKRQTYFVFESGAGVRDALQALNILYVLVATGAAKRDDRYQDTQLHFNIAAR